MREKEKGVIFLHLDSILAPNTQWERLQCSRIPQAVKTTRLFFVHDFWKDNLSTVISS